MSSIKAQVAIVGAGLAGAAAAWRLAQRGIETVLLEAEHPAHGGGSSHGSARIFRHAYPDPFYAELTVRALDGWHELEDQAGAQLLRQTGGLDLGRQRDLPAMMRALDGLGLEAELLDEAAARERWPHLTATGPVLHQPGAGVLDAEAAVLAMVDLARRAGVTVLEGWRLEAAERTDRGWRLSAQNVPTVESAVAVLVAGAWMPELLPHVPLPAVALARLPELVVSQQQAFFFRYRDPAVGQSPWPIMVHKDDLAVYALDGGRDVGGAALKIAEHDGGSRTTASSRSGVVDPRARERITDYVARHLPLVEPEPVDEATCLYTSTPDDDFVIDRVDDMVVVSACSGHGAKFAPLLGEFIADLATDGTVAERFRALTRGG